MMRNGQSATFQLLFQQFLLGTSVPRVMQSSPLRISIEIPMYLKIISITGLHKVGKKCLTQPPPLIYACLCLQLALNTPKIG